jgi:hypothetical protein
VWSVVEGCSQERIVGLVPAVTVRLALRHVKEPNDLSELLDCELNSNYSSFLR